MITLFVPQLLRQIRLMVEKQAVFAPASQDVQREAYAPEKMLAILKALQRHVYRAGILQHVDFQRVVAGQALHVHVPLHFVGDGASVGAKRGGVISHLLNEVEVICLPKDLPEFIEVDVSALDIGESLHLSDLALPETVRLASLGHGESGDLAVVAVIPPKVEPTETPDAG